MAGAQAINWFLLSQAGFPILLLTGVAMVILLLSAFVKNFPLNAYFWISVVAAVVAFALTWGQWTEGMPVTLKMFYFDRLSYLVDLILILSLFLTLVFSKEYLEDHSLGRGEYFSLLLFATVGLMIISHGEDLILIFLGIEIAALSTYILVGMRRGDMKSYEAALKYYVMGAFASAFLLYGIALTYGAIGTTSLSALSSWGGAGMSGEDSLLILMAVAFLLIGVSFKMAVAPFHFWVPDVYEGAPTPITGFMASAMKVGAFMALIRIGLALIHLPQVPWVTVLSVLAALTMTMGNLMALRQTNMKRLLAYSSIAHAGYALVGVVAALKEPTLSEGALGAVVFYLFAYSLMTLGSFALVIALGRSKKGVESLELSDYAGLVDRRPGLALAMLFFMLSFIGIPPTIGFVGKFYLFSAAIEAGLILLVVIAVLNSVISAYYYLAPLIKMYFVSGEGPELKPVGGFFLAGLVICLFAVIYLGLLPSDLYLIARESVRELVF